VYISTDFHQSTGRLGGVFTEEILKTGKHAVTALTRAGSKGKVPEGAKTVEESLVAALKAQQFLVITLSTNAPPETHTNLVKAAIEAGVSYIMPNVYGGDFTNEELANGDIYTQGCAAKTQEIQSLGGTSIGMVCGKWISEDNDSLHALPYSWNMGPYSP
jgi:hypothetical protein